MRSSTRTTGSILAIVTAIVLAGCGDDGEGSDGTANADRISGTFVGAVDERNTYIALVSDGERVAGYLCDGEEVSVWLAPTEIEDGQVELVSRSGVSVGEVGLDSEGGSGEVEIDGATTGFELTPATGDAGRGDFVVGPAPSFGDGGAGGNGAVDLGQGQTAEVRKVDLSFMETGADI